MRRKLRLKKELNSDNKKGFTLVEILAIIAIIAVVFGISTFVYLNLIDSSKKSASLLAINNIKEAAMLYTKEQNDNINWFDNYDLDSDKIINQYACVTVRELINKGYFKDDFFNKDIYDNSNIDDNTSIQIKRDYTSKASFDIEVLPGISTTECEVLASNNSMISSDGYDKYTDTIVLGIDALEDVSNYSCFISEKDGSESNISARRDGNKCIFEKLENVKHYLSKICLTSGTLKSCQSFDVETADFENIEISVTNEDSWESSKDVTITYNDENIYNGAGRHYFKTEFNANINGNYTVYKCTVNSGGTPNQCSDLVSDKKIVSGQLYLVTDKTIKLTVSELVEESGKKISAMIADLTGNNKKVSKIVKKISPLFNLNYNSNGGSTCNPTSKKVMYNDVYGTLCTPTREGYYFEGWYTSLTGGSKVTSTSKYATFADSTIYAHWRAYKVTINFKVDGGSVTAASKANGFGVDSSGYITKDGSRYTYTYYYGEAAKDLPNNDYSGYLELSRSGYSLLTNYAWKNDSGFRTGGICIYSSTLNYNATDFVYESDLQTGDRTVTLTANWKFKAVRMDDRWHIWKGPGYYTSSKATGRLCSVTSGAEHCYDVGTSENTSINNMMYGTYRNVGIDKSFIVFGYVNGSYKAIDDGAYTYKKDYGTDTFIKLYVPYVEIPSSNGSYEETKAGYVKKGGGGSITSSSSKLWYYYEAGKYTTYYAVWVKGTCSIASNPDCSSSGTAILGKY